MATNSEDYGEYRKNKMESGLLYQDFVVDCCWSILGLAVVQYSSKVYQQTVGETRTGVEIKHDEKYVTTGNLWIELAEKAVPRPGDYAKSGINRHDNSWLFAIGNYDVIFIFSTRFLRILADSGHYSKRENRTRTSIGFLLPHDDANRYAAQVLYPNAEEKIGKEIKDLHQAGRALHDQACNGGKDQIQLFQQGQ